MQSAGKVSSDDVRTVENMRAACSLVLRKLEDVISSYDGSVTKPGEIHRGIIQRPSAHGAELGYVQSG